MLMYSNSVFVKWEKQQNLDDSTIFLPASPMSYASQKQFYK